MDVMNPESCKAMLHAVYDPHYEHFSEYFGNTFRGFFSDEPGFFNEDGTYYSTLGREKACLPWNDALPGMLSEKTGLTEKEILNLLPALYHEVEGRTALIREAYMDTATKLYSQNVAWLLGDWCRAHDVLYVGHIIEDMNAHQRLGHGAGHFFRAMDGQDMAGCDVVIHQIVPGFTDLEHSVQLAGDRAYPEFFNYTLPKLASSHAHIQPLKKGRAMCEIFGAFGWSEGIPFMKYLTDIMLVSGINHFVPHAFSAVYPDVPSPIFYSQGMSNYYPVFGELMGYMQRMSHTLTDGVHQADVAVYYNAEAEWAGGKCMLQDVVCQQLARHQIEYDLIPADVLKECSSILKRKLAVHEETYGALIVPYSQYLPEELLKRFVFLAKSGLPIYFVKDYPKGLNGGEFFPIAECVCESVPLDRLADRLISKGHRSLVPDQTIPFLRYFHIYRDGHDIYMLWNEDIHSKIDTTVRFLTAVSEPNAAFYDVWNNRLFSAAKGNSLRISLAPAQAVVVIFSQEEDFSSLPPYDYCEGEVQELNLTWKVSAREMNESEFKDIPLENGLCNLARKLPAFGGILRYESTWHTDCPDLCKYLECTNVGELARLWINDTYCGSIVSAPYRFHIEGMLREGDNHIRIEVCPNLGYRERDHLAAYLPLPPTGLIGPLYCRS